MPIRRKVIRKNKRKAIGCSANNNTTLGDWLKFDFDYHNSIDLVKKRELFERLLNRKFSSLSKKELGDLLPFFLFIRDYKSVKRLLDHGSNLTISSLLKFETTQPGSMNQILFRPPDWDEMMVLLYLLPDKEWDADAVSRNKNFLNISGKPKELKFFYFGGAKGMTVDIIKEERKKLNDIEKTSFMSKVSSNQDIPISEILRTPEIPWDYKEIAKRSDITMNDIKELERNFKKAYASPESLKEFWGYLSSNSTIKMEDIERTFTLLGGPSFVGWPWVWRGIKVHGYDVDCGVSFNPGLTLPFVLRHPNEDWDWRELTIHPNITIREIKESIERGDLQHFDKSLLLENPNMTPEYALEFRRLFEPTELFDWVLDAYGISRYYEGHDMGHVENHHTERTTSGSESDDEHYVYNLAVTFLLRLRDVKPVKERTVQGKKVFDLPFDYIIKTSNGNIPWDWDHHLSRPDISSKIIEELKMDKCREEYLTTLSENLAVPFEYIKSHPEYDWDETTLSLRPDLDLDYVTAKLADDEYLADFLSANPAVTTRYIYDNINRIKWEWDAEYTTGASIPKSVSNNPNLTVGFVLLFLDKLDFGKNGLSSNEFLHNEVVYGRYAEIVKRKIGEGVLPEEQIPREGVLSLIQSYVS